MPGHTPIPEWAFENAVDGSGVTCPQCGELETRSWYSAARPSEQKPEWLLSIHQPCKTAWIDLKEK